MIYTTKIQKAILFAIKTHETEFPKQKRKGKDIPYITHPMTVGLILARAGASEDLIAAGILHDTIEDSDILNKVTMETIAGIFNDNIASLVMSVSEVNKGLSWEERKADAREHIKTFSNDSVLLKSADTLSNVTEIIADHGEDGDVIFKRFKAGKEKTIENYLRVITALTKQWPDSPLVRDLEYVAGKLQLIGAPIFMRRSPAIGIKISEYNENIPLECPVCGWKGTPKTSEYINTDSHFALDVSCPNCDKMLLVATYRNCDGSE